MKNKMVDSLSLYVTLLSIISVEVTGFERLKKKYESCSEFREVYMTLRDENIHIINGYHPYEWYLIWDNKLRIPKTPMHEFLIWEIHARGLSEHYRTNKAIEDLEHQLFWSSLKRDIAKLVG